MTQIQANRLIAASLNVLETRPGRPQEVPNWCH